jgi:spermidine synthase
MWIDDAWDKKRGRTISIKVKKEIETFKSDFQTISVYETECFGKCLVLDNVIMLTEFDEFAYHEMIVHPAMNVHPSPKRVLVIGGGDGGSIREVLKHDVERVVLCEIDEHVIRLSRKHLPSVASGYDDPRVTIACEDGAAYVRKEKSAFDIIIIDSTDPVGPGEVLFREAFYRDVFAALGEEGIAVAQCESMHYDLGIIKKLLEFNRRIFVNARTYYTLVPTYPSGTMNFLFCSKKLDPIKDMRLNSIRGLRYYSPQIHASAFVLPAFAAEATGS